MTDHDDRAREPAENRDEIDDDGESIVDDMRGSGVGVEDPNIVGDPHPGAVDEQVAKDEPPQV